MRRDLARLGLLAFAFVLPWENVVVLPVVGTLGRVTAGLFVLLALAAVPSGPRLALRPPAIAWLLLVAFAAWSAATTFWSLDPAATVTALSTLVQLVALVWAVLEVCDDERRRRAALGAYVAGAYVAIGSAFANLAAGREATFGRFAATNFDPNDFALVVALGVPMAWDLVRGPGLARGVLAAAYTPVALAAVVLSGSRGGAVALAVALGALLVVHAASRTAGPDRGAGRVADADRRTARRSVLVVAAGLLVAATLAAPSAGPAVREAATGGLDRIASIPADLAAADLNERGAIWRAGLDAFPRRPVRGVGLGAFGAAVESSGAEAGAAHNAFLSVLIETGIVGALLFSAILLAVTVPLLGARGPGVGPAWALLATLGVGMLPLSWQLRKPTWFVLAILVAYHGAHLVGRRRRKADPT